MTGGQGSTTARDDGLPRCRERRANGERRRNAGGWFELRARRDGIGGDRRQSPGDGSPRARLLALWRRVRP